MCNTGFSDFLQSPFNHPVILSKIKTHINLAEMVRSLDGQIIPANTHEQELLAAQDAAILCLAAVARIRDHSTGNHILRTQHYVKALAEHLRYHPDYADELDNDDTIEIFYKTASLHDIGKVGIPDAILQKPGKLTPEEYEIMKKHSIHGFHAIHTAELLLAREVKGKAANFLKIAQQVTLSHHERWDGMGYPQGLKEQSIPIVARLMAVADVYDAIISKRPYKDALKHNTASAIIKQGRGNFFDPSVVDAFIDLESTFEKISYILEDYFPSQSDLSLHSFDELIY
jgi:putative two-component system response regulator